MHHLYPLAKGDQLCPLGFHPQVRWPTRCKRCFRDYKEHGSKRNGEDVTASSPSLSDSANSRARDDGRGFDKPSRTWTSTSNLSAQNETVNRLAVPQKRPNSWTSTPDLEENSVDVSVKIFLPTAQRRHTTVLDMTQIEETLNFKRPPLPPSKVVKEAEDDTSILKSDSLAERVRKMQILKRQQSVEREGSREKSVPKEKPVVKKPENSSQSEIKKSVDPEKKVRKKERPASMIEMKSSSYYTPDSSSYETNSQDVQFLIQVKDSNPSQQDDAISNYTETTETTIVGRNDHELIEQIESLKSELDVVKSRCERAERDKSDILLRRLASMDTVSNKTAASEALKLQKQCNDMKQQLEELKDDKKGLTLKVRELEQDLQVKKPQLTEDTLKYKLTQAENLCEELMDENEDMKRELRNMEQEIDEMHDNFREDQADEYTTLKKEMEQTMKNCRILSFKLKKSERKIEQLDIEKQSNLDNLELTAKIKKLEEDLRLANDVAQKLQNENPSMKKKAPSLGMIGKSTSADGKYSRESITRGGSQDDPVQLLRDLQDSMEREADLREQLKFAEEEADTMRKKGTRVEDENESLMMQLKKMATKARSRKLSPTAPSRLTPATIEKDEGISDEEDPAELRLLLELNEQEASVLRRKVEDLENENELSRKQIQDLQDKAREEKPTGKKLPSFLLSRPGTVKETVTEKKIKTLEDELCEIKKKLLDKDRMIEKIQTESQLKVNSKPNGSKKLEVLSEQTTIDVKRQLQIIDQEAAVMRTKIISLEQENEKILSENKKLQVQAARSVIRKDSLVGNGTVELKEQMIKLEKERDELSVKLKKVLDDAADKMPPRNPKKVTDMHTKLQLKRMVEDSEVEINEMRAIILRTGAAQIQKLESEKSLAFIELKDVKEQLSAAKAESKLLKSKQDSSSTSVEKKLKKTEDENNKCLDKIGDLEGKLTKQDSLVKQIEATKNLLEAQIRLEKEKSAKLQKDAEKEKKEKSRWEFKVSELDEDLQSYKKTAEKTKSNLENEITALKSKTIAGEIPSKKMKEISDRNKELEAIITNEMKKLTDLNGKYEVLEEEHVLTKAQLTVQKEKLQNEISSIKLQLSESKTTENKLKHTNNDLNTKITEFNYKLNQLEKSESRNNTIENEKNRLKSTIEERDRILEKLKKENDMNIDLSSQMKKDNEELRKKLDDFERVNKVHRTLNERNSFLEQELRVMEKKLESCGQSQKSEVAGTRLRYEQQNKNLQTEMNSLQRQCERFKRDRDTFKQLLEAAQKSMAEIKQSGRLSRGSIHSGDEDDKSKILALEQQVGCLEDELSEARLEASKSQTELVSEKSASEIKISEMQSKMNEYEEERLMGSGRSGKIPGLKTRLELSWQKEREELQRLLQETSTLARDLRQTLFEVERERDKDKLETRRKLEQLKKANEEELEEGRKKISELQCDLLDLRDAHAKLRTSNEKLRRERERYEKERDNVAKRRLEQDGDRKVGVLLKTVDELVKIAPELVSHQNQISQNNNSNHLTPTPTPRRSKSRSPSPGPKTTQISGILSRLAEAYEELKQFQKINEEDKNNERLRRGPMRRAASTENENEGHKGTGRISRSSTHNGSLYRKSLSLDQSMQQEQQNIWKQDDDSMSSMQSIDSEYGGMNRDSSLDSRLSGGSTQSDMARGPRKKKRGFMGKLRSLTKSKNFDSDGSQQGSESDVSLAGDHRSSKRDLKDRLSGMFRRGQSSSRSNSTEVMSADAAQRPVAVTVATISNGPGTPHLVKKSGKPPTPTATPSTQRRMVNK